MPVIKIVSRGSQGRAAHTGDLNPRGDGAGSPLQSLDLFQAGLKEVCHLESSGLSRRASPRPNAAWSPAATHDRGETQGSPPPAMVSRSSPDDSATRPLRRVLLQVDVPRRRRSCSGATVQPRTSPSTPARPWPAFPQGRGCLSGSPLVAVAFQEDLGIRLIRQLRAHSIERLHLVGTDDCFVVVEEDVAEGFRRRDRGVGRSQTLHGRRGRGDSPASGAVPE